MSGFLSIFTGMLNYVVFIFGMALCMTATFMALITLYRWLDRKEKEREEKEDRRIYEDYFKNGRL